MEHDTTPARECRWRGQRGNLLLIITMMVMVASVMVAAVAKMASSNSVAGLDSLYATHALYVAESGLEAARYSLMLNGCVSSGFTLAGTLPTGEYSATVSSGPPWTITSTGYAPSQDAPQGKRTVVMVVPDLNPMIATGYTITGTPQVSVNADGSVAVNVSGSGNSIRADAVRENINQFSPILPAFQTSSGADGSITVNADQTILAGKNYTTITISSGRTYTFNPGVHRIQTLNINGTASMGAGTYYIAALNMTGSNNAKLNPTGAVVINTNNFNINRIVNINNEAGYTVGNLIVYVNTVLYWQSGTDNTRFNGTIIGKAGMTNYRFRGNGITIRGGVYSQRPITIDDGNNFDIIFDSVAKTAASTALGVHTCSGYTSWDETF